MCGIIGYTGFRDAKQLLIECLKRLDYRGYDSAGIGIIEKKLKVFKETGEISNLEKTIPKLNATMGIGHNRWATHGKVNKENAHPHVSCNKKIAVVHNGIIENFKQLKEYLEKKGHKLTSQTDTEVIAHLIEEEYKKNLEDAVFSALKKIQGSYAIAVLCENEPKKLVGARKESPLVIGVGDNENFLASDIPAMLKYTNRVVFLEDNELCVLTNNSIKVYNIKNKREVKKEENIIDWDVQDAEKSGFPHFMLKEIFDQPNSIQQTLRGRISEIERSINLPENVEKLLDNELDIIHIVACGTSFYAGLVGKYIIEKITGIPVIAEFASEYRYFGNKDSSLTIAITQSGETADTLAALKEAKNSGNRTLVITNVIGSTATRVTDGFLLNQSGPEIGVAATKTFTSQIIILFLIALKIASKKDKIGLDEVYNYIRHLKELPRQIRQILDSNEQIEDIAKQIKDAKSVFFIGRGMNYPLSLEGALKLKEISYLHAEGFTAGELKHGPFALLTKDTPVIAIATPGVTYAKILANIGEVKARGSQVIAIAKSDDTEIEKHADFVLNFPSNSSLLSCIPIAVILQLLAYHVANLKGCKIDKPRNLAKSVTVE